MNKLISLVLFITLQFSNCNIKYLEKKETKNNMSCFNKNIDSMIFIAIKPRSKIENKMLTKIFFKYKNKCLEYVLNSIKIEEVRNLVWETIKARDMNPKSYPLEFQLFMFAKIIQKKTLDLFFTFFSEGNTNIGNNKIEKIKSDTETNMYQNCETNTIESFVISLRNKNIFEIYIKPKYFFHNKVFKFETRKNQLINEILLTFSKIIIENVISCAFSQIFMRYEDLFEMLKDLNLTDISYFTFFSPYKQNENYATDPKNKNSYIRKIIEGKIVVSDNFLMENSNGFPFLKPERKRQCGDKKSISSLVRNDRKGFLDQQNNKSVFYETNNVVRIEKLESAYGIIRFISASLKKYKESNLHADKTLIIIDLDLQHLLTDIILNYFIHDKTILEIIENNKVINKKHGEIWKMIAQFLHNEINKYIPKPPDKKESHDTLDHQVIQIKTYRMSADKIHKIISAINRCRKTEFRLQIFIFPTKDSFFALIDNLMDHLNQTITQHLLSI